LTSTKTNGEGYIHATNCIYYPEIPDYQKWHFWGETNWTDPYGIKQTLYNIRNYESNWCWMLNGDDIALGPDCDKNDARFFFRNRGKVLKNGLMQLYDGNCAYA